MLLQEDLTISMLEKCKQSQPVIKDIIESTTDDEGMLVEALNLHEELQQVISRYEQLEAAENPGGQQPEKTDPIKYEEVEATQKSGEELPENSVASKSEESEAAQKLEGKLPEKPYPLKAESSAPSTVVDLSEAEGCDSGREKKNEK